MDTSIKFSIIAAVSDNGVIGVANTIPWYIRDDLKFFKQMTEGHTLIMGSQTFQSIGSEALPKRTMIVLTHKTDCAPKENCFFVNSIEEAIQKAQEISQYEEVFVIGGQLVYEQMLSRVGTMYITRVHTEIDLDIADALFPAYDTSEWEETVLSKIPHSNVNQHTCTCVVLKRRTQICLHHGRISEQIAAMERIQDRGVCPFCLENLSKEHTKPLLDVTSHWVVTENQWPYKEAKHHILIISREHIRQLSEISDEGSVELLHILSRLEALYGSSGGCAIRFGDPEITGGTVNHLHVHFLIPHETGIEGYAPIRFRIGGKK